MKSKPIALLILLGFMLIYTTVGISSSLVWSGFYFISVHTSLLLFLYSFKNKVVKIGGVALQITILIYVICKFFIGLNYDRVLSTIPFLITCTILFLIEKNKNKNG